MTILPKFLGRKCEIAPPIWIHLDSSPSVFTISQANTTMQMQAAISMKMDLSNISPPSHLQRLLFLSPGINHRRVINSASINKNARINSKNFHSCMSVSASYDDNVDATPSLPSSSYQAEKPRKLLASPRNHLGPACFDALQAKLVEHYGFDWCFTPGIWFPTHNNQIR